MRKLDSKCSIAYQTLRSEILSGRYSIDKPFPSVTMLTRRFGISSLTAVKVLDRLKEGGLVRSHQGRGTFVTKQAVSRLIGLVIPGIAYSSEFFQPIIAEFVRLARKNDFTILMEGVWSSEAKSNGSAAVDVAAQLIKRKVAGVIFQPIEYFEDSEALNRRVLSAFDKAHIPVTLLDGDIVMAPMRSEYDLVSIDNVSAGEILARHVMGRGAKSLRFLMRANWVANVQNRALGVRNAVLSGGGKWSDRHVLTFDPSDVQRLKGVLRTRPRPDAFICENDVIAAELVKSLGSLGYAVPKDVLVAGFDDVRISKLSSPGITSIHQPCEEIAQLAFERLLRRMSTPTMPSVHLTPQFALVVRESTSPATPAVAARKRAQVKTGKGAKRK